MRLDMHTHTTASDGQHSPGELMTMAKAARLEMIAVTDHDTIEGICEARRASEEVGICLIPGIEISTYLDEEIHILGLWIDETNPVLVGKCREYTDSRKNRGRLIVDYLKDKGMEIDLDEIMAYAGGGSMGRPHFAWALQKHGYVSSCQEAFERFLDTPEFHERTDRRKPTPQEAIGLIHGAGGKAVLAHPGLLKMGQDRQRLLVEELKAAGLDAIEAYYSKYTNRQIRIYTELARKLALKVTAGSDFHGEKVKKNVKLGMDFPSYNREILLNGYYQTTMEE